MTDDALQRAAGRCIFWGKFRAQPVRCLPLVCHCLDVGIVLRALLDLPAIRRALERAGGRGLEARDLDRLAVLAMLHDLGKLNLGFQYKVFDLRQPRAGHVRELAAVFDDEVLAEALAAAIGIDALEAWCAGDGDLESLLYAVWSHHGWPVSFDPRVDAGSNLAGRRETWRAWWSPRDGHDPIQGADGLMRWARRAFAGAFQAGGPPLPAAPRFQHLYAGLVMLADWLGSDARRYPVEGVPPEDRLREDPPRAAEQVAAVGLDVAKARPVLQQGPGDFRGRFGFEPRPLQAAVDALTPDLPASRLVIAESETGSGKTEAALHWFGKLFAAGEVDGLYFALPTRVAARELYERMRGTVSRWFPDPETAPVTVLAVPGYARVDGLPAERTLPGEEEANRWQDDEELRRRERQWAAEHPKRFLAATVAVGTIDQALLSVVQTAHAHLRSACLSRSLLVVDEVHASDLYMARLLEHLLGHHLALGGRAMLLSATLGARARVRFVAAAEGQDPGRAPPPPLEAAEAMEYPRLSLGDGSARPCACTGPGRPKQVTVEESPLAFSPEAIADRIAAALESGARVLVVMNTVGRANALHRALESDDRIAAAWQFRCRGTVCPHHGRFAPRDRVVLDAAVSERFGKQGPPGPALVIGTQTLEQSLDIDADLLLTDLAPADVLLQRIGRLHRHRRPRPAGFDEARCMVLVPEAGLEEALDAEGRVVGSYKALGYGSVYEDLRTLELTRRALRQRPRIEIPRDNRRLVEAVTHPEALARLQESGWQEHGRLIEGGELARASQAGMAIIDFDRAFGEFVFSDMGEGVATRLGAGTLQLPLERPVTSPFGQELHEMTIPGHLAPERPGEQIAVEGVEKGVIHLRCGGRRYVYSRYGLETREEP